MSTATRTLTLLGFVLAFFAFAPGPRDAAAQPTDCEWCTYDFGIDKHRFTGNGCDDELSPYCMNCKTLNSCHDNWQTGLCQSISGSPGHWQCYYEPLAARVAEEAMEAGEEARLLALAAAHPETVAVTDDGYVVLLSCTGTVVRSTRMSWPNA